MKRKLFNSFMILSFSSIVTKIFSILNRMLLTRLISPSALTLYLLVTPTLSLCITLGQLSIPSAVFRLVSNPKYNNKKVVITAIILALFSTSVIMISLFMFAYPLASNLLKNNQAYYPILSLLIFIPFVALSGILKSYFLGKEQVGVIAKTQFIEEISRLCFTYLILSNPLSTSDVFMCCVAYISMSVGELASILYLLTKLRKYRKVQINFRNCLIPRDIINISIPLTGSRLYHCFVSFIEPITLIYVLSSIGVAKSVIQNEYAIISGFVLSTVVMPSFFNTVIYRLYLPIITNDLTYSSKQTYKHLFLALGASFLIALPFTVIFYYFPEICIKLVYNTTKGWQELKYISIPFIVFYLQTPLSAVLHAGNKNKAVFIISSIECTIELILTFVLAYRYGVKSIIVSLLVGIIFTLFSSAIMCVKTIKENCT